MNVDSIQEDHWCKLTNLALPLVQELRETWKTVNKLSPSPSQKPLVQMLLDETTKGIGRQVKERFYSELYSKMTAGLSYALNLPGEPDAAWEKLVAIWEATQDYQRSARKLVEAYPDLAKDAVSQRASKQIVSKPSSHAHWVPNQQRAQCRTCKTDFGVFTRKHHCRLCGEVFCDNCTRKQLDINNPLDEGRTGRLAGLHRNQRVCDACYDFWVTLRQDLAKNPPTTDVVVQQDKKSGTSGARLYECYNSEGTIVSRFQFVVTEGGGIVLLDRLDKAFGEYFHENPDAKKAFNCWKIFGEAQARGRSDSCVIYLCAPYRDPRVSRFWNHYILSHPRQRYLRDSIATSFIAPGLFSMGNGAWAIDMPGQGFETAILKSYSKNSAGGLISSVLGVGYANAAKFFHDKPDVPLIFGSLRQRAEYEVRLLVKRLYQTPGPLPKLDGALSRVFADAPAARWQALPNRMGGRL